MEIFAKETSDKQELTEDQQKEVTFVKDFYDAGIEARRPYEKQWYLNMAFFLGKQWVNWNTARRQLEVPLAPSYRVRLVCNRIMPNVLHIVSKLSQNRPQYVVIPSKSESEALNAAITSDKVLTYIQQLNLEDLLNQRLLLWMSIYGTAFKHPYWNAFVGQHLKKQKLNKEKKINPETQLEEEIDMPILDEQGQPTYFDVYTGEVEDEILSPFNILPEGGATNLEDSFRVMRLITKPVEYVRENYEAGKFVQPETNRGYSSIEDQLKKLMDDSFQVRYIGDTRKITEKTTEGFVTLKNLREKPSKKHPKGRDILVAGDVLLNSDELPYEFMYKRSKPTLGIVKYDYIEVPDRFWGRTPVEDLIPVQIEYNKTRSQIIEIKNLTAKPKWIAFKQSHISKTSITSEPGEVIEPTYAPNVPEPHPIDPPNLPAYVTNELQVNEKDIGEIGLIHEVSRGTTPPGIRSGVAIQFLQEQDQTVFQPVVTRFEARESQSGTYMLELVKEKYKEKRVLKIMGKDNDIEIMDFIASEDMPTEVRVISGSALPQSKVAKQQLILQYFQSGLFGDPQDESVRRRALKLAEIGGLDALYKDIVADERKAERENRAFERGEIPQVDNFDVHSVHIRTHDLWRKSDSYARLQKQAETDPNIKKIVDGVEEHVATHMQNSPEMMASQKQQETEERYVSMAEKSNIGEQQKDIAQAQKLAVQAESEKVKQQTQVLEQARKESGEE